MTAYYNEIDPFAAAWLRELIKVGAIAPGDVDERSIEDVRPDELAGYTQCHFFGGIGVWSCALRLAGWPDDKPVWTGSCPCQPFSAAGKGAGFADERHLWPAWHWLIRNAKPRDVPVFGEQVASKDGLAWLDLVQADMEGEGYAVWPVDLCAAGVGAPHIRQRLWFVAERLDDTPSTRHVGAIERAEGATRDEARMRLLGEGCAACGLADADSREQQRFAEFRGVERNRKDAGRSEGCGESQSHGELRGMADPDGKRPEELDPSVWESEGNNPEAARCGSDGDDYCLDCGRNWDHCICTLPRLTSCFATGPTNGFWQASDWLLCRDGKWRPVEPGTFPLAHGTPARVGRLRGYGNAINAEAARTFIEAYIEVRSV